MKHLPLLMICLFLWHSLAFAQAPVSKQATLVETISSSEVLVEACGIYMSGEKSSKARLKDVENNGISRALEDARKAAVWLIVLGGTDPILRNAEEIQAFEARSAQFYSMQNIGSYIAYEDQKFIQRVSLEGGEGIKVSKRFKINKELILKDLERLGIISGRQELAQALGRPQLMVIPNAPKGRSPLDFMRNDPVAKHAATVIESHLTAKQYEVLSALQTEQISSLSGLQSMASGMEDDISYLLALSIGSDIYLTYSGAWETATYNTNRYSMTVNAFETSSGRLLGSETGYSQARQGEAMICIEEAMNPAIDAVLNRIESYWRDDLRRGVQYKIILRISSSYSQDEAYDMQDIFVESLAKLCNATRENVSTAQTLDMQVWVDPARYSSSRNLLRDLRKNFADSSWTGELSTVSVNRKLILLSVN